MDILKDTQFKKDVKLFVKRGKDMNKLKDIIDKLFAGVKLPAKNKDHKLKGLYHDFRECHIEPDWLLIYKIENNTLYLVRTGSHSDIFG